MGYNNNYNNYPSQNKQKKKSGAKCTFFDDDKVSLHAWNSSKSRGLISLKAFENKKSKSGTISKGKNKGDQYVSLIAEVFYHRTGNTVIEPIVYNIDSGKAYLSKLNMVVSTKARNGGFFGKAKP